MWGGTQRAVSERQCVSSNSGVITVICANPLKSLKNMTLSLWWCVYSLGQGRGHVHDVSRVARWVCGADLLGVSGVEQS